jgi:hypothetical protein
VDKRLDVAARLAQGHPAVEHTQTFVRACHALGYSHADLTAHDSQVSDWYETEAGLDLRVLDDDCAALRAAANATEEALAAQRAQIAELAAVWTGPGADSAMRFLRCHRDAATETAAHLRAAAEGCDALRDNLWQLVDGKVATAIAVDDRGLAQRSSWLAAAQTVTTGVGDRTMAEELVRQQVMPYVDNDVRNDWLSVMRSTVASVAASYDAVTDALAESRQASFQIPGDLGPPPPTLVDEPRDPAPVDEPHPPAPVDEPRDPAPPIFTTPAETAAAGAGEPLPAPPAAVMAPAAEPLDPLRPLPDPPTTLDGLPPASPLSESTAPLGDAAGIPAGVGSLGGPGELAGGPGGLGGVIGRIVDGVGSLLGSLTGGLAEPSLGDGSLVDDPLGVEGLSDEDPAERLVGDAKDAKDATDADDAALAGAEEANDGTDDVTPDENPSHADDLDHDEMGQEVTAQPVDTPPDAPPTQPSPPATESAADRSTPCQIAADELPQAGQ